MFLHNVANDKAEISQPWHEYNKQGNSLFLWQFFFGWITFAAVIFFFIHGFKTAKILYEGDFLGIEIFTSIASLVLIFIGILIVFGYISLFLKDFVVPIMYKKRISVLTAWSNFLSLLSRHFFSFIIYGLFIFVLGIAVAIGVILLAVLTCCIGLLIIAIPFIGAIVLLPISYTFRAFSIEFLKQFGPDYDVFPNEEITEINAV
jgi:hypothetical protein